jgi:hypothetical protein
MRAQGDGRVGRRDVLGVALAGTAAAAAAVLASPVTALGATGDVMHVGEDNAATATTSITATGAHALLAQTNAGDGLRGWTDGAASSGVFGYATNPAGYGVYGKNGGRGVAALGTYGAAMWASTAGYAAPLALLIEGNAQFIGKAQFSRSGKAAVLKGHTYVDVTVPGGLNSHSVVHATLQTYRAGVAIAAVRSNYPAAGKARIYLTKVASSTASTWVGWLATEY